MKENVGMIWDMVLESNLWNIFGAILILVLGWLLALWCSHWVSLLMRGICGQKMFRDDSGHLAKLCDSIAGKCVFYLIMGITLLGCFSSLDLTAAAEPLQLLLSRIAAYVPNIAGAFLLFVIAWITAGAVRAAVRTVLLKSPLIHTLADQTEKQQPQEIAEASAKTIYYIVFLCFLPAILNTLKIYGITRPLQSMFEKVLTFLPNLIAAVAILVAGLFVAGLIRRAVVSLSVICRLNSFGEKLGVSRIFGKGGISAMIGVVSYILVAIPVVISALTALQIDALSRTVGAFFAKLLNAAGNIIGAALILFTALIAGGFLASLVTQFMAAVGLDRLLAGMGVRTDGQKGMAPSVIAGKISCIALMLLALLAASDVLGFTQLSLLLKSFAVFGGNILQSVIVLLIGLWLANFAASAVEGKCAPLVGNGIRAAVVIFTIALAISNLKIGDSIVQIAFALILGAVCLAAAIAFGVGGREAAGKLLNRWLDKMDR